MFCFSSVVKHFRNVGGGGWGGGKYFLLSLDAPKAFDRINHCYLFSCLCEKGFPKSVIAVFVSRYRNLCVCVKWNCFTSDYFSILSGTHQVSLFSGKRFNLVIDKLLAELEKESLGCHINGIFAGAKAYAGNILLFNNSKCFTNA